MKNILFLLNPLAVAKRLIEELERLQRLIEQLQDLVAQMGERVEDKIDYTTAFIASEVAENANAAGQAVVDSYAEVREKAAKKLFAGNPDLVLVYPLLKRAFLKRLEGQSHAAKLAKTKILVEQLRSLTPEQAKTLIDELVEHALQIIMDRLNIESDLPESQ